MNDMHADSPATTSWLRAHSDEDRREVYCVVCRLALSGDSKNTGKHWLELKKLKEVFEFSEQTCNELEQKVQAALGATDHDTLHAAE